MEIVLDVAGAADVQSVLAISGDEERLLLRQLRDEASTLALMVRLENEKRRMAWVERTGRAPASEGQEKNDE